MDERPASADIGLTDSEQRLLDHIRAGLVDAEIAVRLGITNAEVKSRTERLATKLRVDGREGLKHGVESAEAVDFAAPSSPESTPRRLQLFAGLGGLGVLAVVGSLVAVWAGQADEDPSAAADRDASSTAAAPPGPVGPTTPTDTPRPLTRPRVIDSRMMYDLGQLFRADDGIDPVASVEIREAAVVVTLRPGAQLSMVTPVIAWVVSGSGPSVIQAQGFLTGGQGWAITLFGDEHTTFASRLPGGPERPASIPIHSSSPDGQATLVITAARPDDRTAPRASRWHHLRISRDGSLLVSEDTLPPGVVIDRRTHERIEVPLNSVRLSGLVRSELYNFCEPALCRVVGGAEPLLAPFEGRYSCDPGTGTLRLEDSFRALEFMPVRVSKQPVPPCPEEGDREVLAGDFIGPSGGYSITARGTDLEPLSVAVDEGGDLLIGRFGGSGRCPCLVSP